MHVKNGIFRVLVVLVFLNQQLLVKFSKKNETYHKRETSLDAHFDDLSELLELASDFLRPDVPGQFCDEYLRSFGTHVFIKLH